jgi:hypothetical protein
VEVVDLDLLSQTPQEYARIMRGKGEESSSRGSIMMVKNMLKNSKEQWRIRPLLYPFKKNNRLS